MAKEIRQVTDAVGTTPATIKLRSIEFSKLPFRRLGSLTIKIAPRLTLIAGRNGVGKSTILALAAGASGLTKGGTKAKSYFGKLPQAHVEDILKLSYERDFIKAEDVKPYVDLQYRLGDDCFRKRCNVSGSESRLRVVPRNEPRGEYLVGGIVIPADGKVPLPTIYLGMMRVLPVGEAEPDTLVCSAAKMHPDDGALLADFINRVISTGAKPGDGKTTTQAVRGTKKFSVHPEYEGYDSTNVSLGQDSLSSIATAIASFNKLQREFGDKYRGGILVIDEVDAGFHPHAQLNILRELKREARRLRIQIIATTHSLTMLEAAHHEIFNDMRQGESQDEIVYLQGGKPIEILDVSRFQSIHDDMHLRLSKAVETPSVKVYVEDEEAALFLEAILTTARKTQLLNKTGRKIKTIAAKVGCSNLVGLLKADDYFSSVVIVLDADTTNVKIGAHGNVIRLPSDPRVTLKLSPEVIVSTMAELICRDEKAYPLTRKKIKSAGGSTDHLQDMILNPRPGESRPSTAIHEDREVAKAWFNNRLDNIQQLKLIEGWVADNESGVADFMLKLEAAILSVVKSPPGQKQSRKLSKPMKSV